jgi:hypothetical protein
MLNEVVIEGLFTGKSWSYSGDLLFRLASYRDRQRPTKLQTEGREQPDYITVRLLASGVPVALQKGAIYRVHGYLQSRDYAETLGEFVKGANGLTNLLSASDEIRREIKHNRVTTEVVAERLILVEKPTFSTPAAGRRSPADPVPAADDATGTLRKPGRNGNGAKDAVAVQVSSEPDAGQ